MASQTAALDQRFSRVRAAFQPMSIVAILLSLWAVASHLYVASRSLAPVYWEDEAGYLANAQVIAGYGAIPHMSGQSYYPGWSMFLVPLWWILQNPDLVYRAAVVVSALFGVGIAVPLALIARRFGLTWPQAVIAGVVVVIGPGQVLLSNFALSENCLGFFFALTCLLALRYAASPTLGRAAAFGAAAAYTFIIHGRAVPVVIAAVLWFGWRIVRRHLDGVIGLVVTLAVTGIGLAVYIHVSDLIFPATGREANGVGKMLDSTVSGTSLAGAGQIWFHVVATCGLVAFGLAAIGVLVVRELRAKSPAAAVWIALAILGVAAISFTYISGGVAVLKPRLDIYVYSRYLEPFMTVVALAGAIALLRVSSRRFVRLTAAIAGGVIVIYCIIGLTIIPDIGTTGWWAPVNVLGLLQWPWPNVSSATAIPFLGPTIVALVALGLAVILRKRAIILLVIIAVYLGGSSIIAEKAHLRPFTVMFYKAFTLRDVVREYDNKYAVSFDTAGLTAANGTTDTVSHNAYQYWLAPHAPAVFDSATTAPKTQLVISRKSWPVGVKLGARLIARDSVFDNALWVMPGALQDKLAKAGKLLSTPTG